MFYSDGPSGAEQFLHKISETAFNYSEISIYLQEMLNQNSKHINVYHEIWPVQCKLSSLNRQVRTEINKEIEAVSKAADPLKILASADTMKVLAVQRPLLQVRNIQQIHSIIWMRKIITLKYK